MQGGGGGGGGGGWGEPENKASVTIQPNLVPRPSRGEGKPVIHVLCVHACHY